MESKEFYTLDELEDEFIGKEGTDERAKYESDTVNKLIGDSIKIARRNKNLSQSELGDLIGTKKSRVSSTEHGSTNFTIDTIRRYFTALGVPVKLEVEGIAIIPIY